MYCKNCGAENAENTKSCCKCGKLLQQGGKSGKRWVWICAASILAVSVAAGILVPYSVQATQKRQLKSKLSLGEKYLEEMQYEKAAALYLDAIDIEEKEPDAYMGLAASYLAMEEYDKADQAYEAAITHKEAAREETKQEAKQEEAKQEEAKQEGKQPEDNVSLPSAEPVTQVAEKEVPAVFEEVIQYYAGQKDDTENPSKDKAGEENTQEKSEENKKSEPASEKKPEENRDSKKDTTEEKTADSKDESTNDSVPENDENTVVSALTNDASKENKNAYDAYYELLQKYEKEKGKGQIKSQIASDNTEYKYQFLSGLCFARLGDFDGDKSEELLVVYGTMLFSEAVTEHAYTAEIWKYEKGNLRQMNKNLTAPFYLYNGGVTEIHLVQVKGQTYLIQGFASEGEYHEVLGMDESGDFTEVTSLEIMYDADGMKQYRIDGEQVEQSAYEKAYTKWCEPGKAYALYKSEKEEKLTLNEYETTVKTIKGKASKKEQEKKPTEQTQGREDRLKKEMAALEAYMNNPASPMDHSITYCLPKSVDEVVYRQKVWWHPIYDEADTERTQPLYYAVSNWESDTENQVQIYSAEVVDMPPDSELASATDEPEVIADLTDYY